MTNYDIIHFEALGPEAQHLKEETLKAQREGKLPEDFTYLITPSNVQDFLKENPGTELPRHCNNKNALCPS